MVLTNTTNTTNPTNPTNTTNPTNPNTTNPNIKEMTVQQITKKINEYRENHKYNLNAMVYPYYTSFIDFIKYTRHIKLLSNISFYTLLFAFITRADLLVRILIPINLCNCILIFLVIIFEFENLFYHTLGNSKFQQISLEKKKAIIDNDNTIKKIGAILMIIYHTIVIIITLTINHYYQGEYYPFLFIFGCSILFLSGFLLVSKKNLYGEIKEQLYITLYMFSLFTLNYLLNNQQQY
jgi:hypothetical protein